MKFLDTGELANPEVQILIDSPGSSWWVECGSGSERIGDGGHTIKERVKIVIFNLAQL